jgi:hypothetical protein
VVGERRAPTELGAGTLPTLEGGSVAIEKTGDAYTVNGRPRPVREPPDPQRHVYLIDTVLMPTA